MAYLEENGAEILEERHFCLQEPTHYCNIVVNSQVGNFEAYVDDGSLMLCHHSNLSLKIDLGDSKLLPKVLALAKNPLSQFKSPFKSKKKK